MRPPPPRAPVGGAAALLALAVACCLASVTAEEDKVLAVISVPFEEGAADARLGALAAAALAAGGVPAAAAPAPPDCAPPLAPDGAACTEATLRALAGGAVQAALVPVPASRPPHPLLLRDAGLEELGDAAPPARRACFAAGAAAPLRTLLALADPALAAAYHLPEERVDAALGSLHVQPPHALWYFCPDLGSDDCTVANGTRRQRSEEAPRPATLLTGDVGEARLLARLACQWRLHACVAALGAHLPRVAAALTPTPLVACDRALRLPGEQLAPPPCTHADCPFEARRILKVVNARQLANSPSAFRILSRLSVDEAELRELSAGVRDASAVAAAHPQWWRGGAEVRVAVMVPAATRRHAYDALALRAAAELAERDLRAEGALRVSGLDFKAELLDDGCEATLPFKYLTDALGTEFGALSAVAGPACAAAFADVARQSSALSLPVLAYTAQAPPPGGLALLAGGDGRLPADVWAAFMERVGWRRLALLSELATRSTLDVARLRADIIVHLELNPQDEAFDYGAVVEWARRVASVNGRILYVCVEDARVVRAALCAGRLAGLAPATGAVWALPAHLPRHWLLPAPGDVHNCTRAQLEEAADGHFSVTALWFASWETDRAQQADGAHWTARWRDTCARIVRGRKGGGAEACSRPDAHAALLYDALRLWAAALRRLVSAHPAAVDDLHRPDLDRELVEHAVRSEYSGLTGNFEWEEGRRARTGPLLLQQWSNGSRVLVGEWTSAGGLDVREGALRWRTSDARAPDDGTESCPLQPLADALRADCRAAFIALAAVLLALAVTALSAAAWMCKRRAEREYRARLAALGLGLGSLGPKPGGLDRWEVPREHVVINRKLGTGAFGTVYGGHALLAEDRGWTAVAVKTLKAGATTEEKLDFLSEAEAMKRFEHKNVVRLLGVVTKTEPVCTVMEFMLYGDLKGYLLARRHLAGAGGAEGEEVSAARLTAMALDAARALSYLAQLRYVHRDVAARNCLVSASRVVKLADFGMTRLVFENDYYRFSRKGMLPVRWMAPESLALGIFSSASDVWSFGVLLYEIVTFGALPFQGLSNAEVLARVKAGHTVDLPPGLKPQLEGLIKSCWRQDYRSRPAAAEVAAFLADSPRLLTPCPDVPLDALPLDAEAGWRAPRDAEARWVSWGAPASAATDTTYLSADAPPADTDAFLPAADA
ncbi:hypothetical protein K1T71_002904 [Dendrolimus kikuchii]|uniref:Uncharacterized protein n=1 Tax=Dendrolimus kikuchii TaxID=765133 RepID=A0ACC1DFI3_9NEOP|nr:hypothetical protein K1T71_002904 [Dendrolimus kikuchii]